MSSIIDEMKEMIKKKLNDLASFAETHSECEDYLIGQLETTLDMIMTMQAIINYEFNSVDSSNISNSLCLVQQALTYLNQDLETDDLNSATPRPSVIRTGMVGRPAVVSSKEVLEFYVLNDFKVKDIACILNISERTVYRRLDEYNLRLSDSYSRISDQELNDIVSKISKEYPCLGYRSMVSLLKNEGHKVQEQRVRKAMRETDPEGVLFRRLFLNAHRIQRRGYHVRGPQALWHIDGNHKLIRWRFIIHGGIDGFSRLPVFLSVNTNNRAETVLNAFKEAVREFGLPERVRSDKGKENVMVAEYMLMERGVECKPFIAGRSVHNQRIERLWREVWCGCSCIYYNIFYHMEEIGILEPHNETHLAVLHMVYKERIQKHLNTFKAALSKRPLRTERNKTPWQLWLSGVISNPQFFSDHDTEEQLFNYGVEHVETPLLTHMESIDVPSTEPIENADQTTIREILDRESELGIDIYQDILSLIS